MRLARFAPLLALAGLAGCDASTDTGTELGPPPTRLRFVVTADVNVEGAYDLLVASEEQFGCGGYAITHRFSRSGRALTFRAEGVRAPAGPCATVNVPASAYVPLTLPDGVYDLVFQKPGDEDRYRLTIRAGAALTAEPVEATFTSRGGIATM